MCPEGQLGNVGEPMRLLVETRLRSAVRMGKDSRRAEAARASAASRVWEHTGHKARRVTQGIGGGEGEPNEPETGYWQS